MLTVHQRHRQMDGQTDGRTTYDSNIALVLRASRGENKVNIGKLQFLISIEVHRRLRA